MARLIARRQLLRPSDQDGEQVGRYRDRDHIGVGTIPWTSSRIRPAARRETQQDAGDCRDDGDRQFGAVSHGARTVQRTAWRVAPRSSLQPSSRLIV
jgi:hypothetical protein